MSYKDKTWTEREGFLGDEAEKQFEHWSMHYDLGYERYGLLRPNLDMRELPAELRYTPDYLTEYGFVEVQGCGHDGLLKFKHDKLDALKWWDKIYPVTFWLWNSATSTDAQCGLRDVLDRTMDSNYVNYMVDGMFDGNKPYSTVRFTDLLQ
jgi:hypothetical protein